MIFSTKYTNLTMLRFIFNKKCMYQGEEIQKTLKEILEIVHFMKDTFATREELYEVRDELQSQFYSEIKHARNQLRTEIKHTRDEMINHVDGFIQLHNNHEAEISSIRMRMSRMEEQCSGT